MLHLEDPDAEEEIMNLLLEGEIGIQLLDQEVIDRDIYWNVWKIVKSLKKDWRDVLILRVLEGLTAEEACAVLKIKSTVCCTRLYRAKAELQKRVFEHGIHGPEGHALSRPDVCEAEAVSRLLYLAHLAGDAPVNVVHL